MAKDNNAEQQKFCNVCGMPMVKPGDFPGGDTTKDYCVHCGIEEAIFPYERLVEGMAGFLEKSQGMDHKQALIAAEEVVANSVACKTGKISKSK